MLRLIFISALASLVGGLRHADLVREIMTKEQTPSWVVVLDGVQRDTLAYTDADRKRIYVDFERFRDAPNSLRNVLKHEAHHAKNREHNQIVGDIMSYAVTLDQRVCLLGFKLLGYVLIVFSRRRRVFRTISRHNPHSRAGHH